MRVGMVRDCMGIRGEVRLTSGDPHVSEWKEKKVGEAFDRYENTIAEK
jgi:ribosomal 30S subunit maturation factor RimM